MPSDPHQDFRDPDQCPACGGDSYVIESRPRENCRWRLRLCRDEACRCKWDTFEVTMDPDELRPKLPISRGRHAPSP